MSTKTTILGCGAMGTACAILLAEKPGQRVTMWSPFESDIQDLEAHHENRKFLPGVTIPSSVTFSADIATAVDEADFLVVAIPTRFLRKTLESITDSLIRNRPVISVVKGLEHDTFSRPSQIVEETLGARTVVVLSGPSHAEEIARKLPASVVAASGDVAMAKQVQEMFSNDHFRVYTNQDPIGVELSGALKNVIAIAAGICDGLGYGDNAKSALMTRGIVEMSRFGAALGAEPTTFAGLAGIGDLITTCISPHGRNRAVGERLGKGETLEQILSTMAAEAEGVNATGAVYHLAEQRGIEMPITQQVYAVLFEGKSPVAATQDLMDRPYRDE
ncbi:MAG: NAD(P)H-dependent glycerol-3-phosphate dehydrogenase [Planctomycetaceae bacterium]